MAAFSLAVDEMKKKQAQAEEKEAEVEITAYFIRCIAFDRQIAFLDQYGKQGVKFAMEGYLSIGGYEKEGVKIPTKDVVENIQFCESNNHGVGQVGEHFLEIPEEMQEEMPLKSEKIS